MTSIEAEQAKKFPGSIGSLEGLQQRVGSRVYWPLILLMGIFAATAFVVPLLAPVSINDDWVYARSVEILMREGSLRPLDVSSAVYPFQTLWAGLFALLFGTSLGVFRLSTFVLVLLSAPAVYGICRELGLSRHIGLLGAAVYLFNPILFALAYSFMTDPHYVALLVISVYLYLRGFNRESPLWLVSGSVAATCAFLVRQHGILIPIAVGSYLLLTRRVSFSRKSLFVLAQATGIPAVAGVIYMVWLTKVNGIPVATQVMTQNFMEAPLDERLHLLWRLIVITLMYSGLFILPIAVSLVPRAPALIKSLSPRGIVFVGTWLAVLLAGLLDFARLDRFMPLIPDRINSNGIGPADVIGDRPPMFDDRELIIFTAIVALASIVLAIAIGANAIPGRKTEMGAGILLAIAGWQALALFLVSHWFRKYPLEYPPITVDRYVVVLLPFVICLLLWWSRNLTFPTAGAWILVLLFAGFSVVGTRDFLVFNHEVWKLAAKALEMGIPANKLDAGAGWDGYHVSDESYFARESRTPNPPWWIPIFAPDIDSTYLISTKPVEGYAEMRRVSYSQWLNPERAFLYLSKRSQPPSPSA